VVIEMSPIMIGFDSIGLNKSSVLERSDRAHGASLLLEPFRSPSPSETMQQ
jgi:hypothetical protein